MARPPKSSNKSFEKVAIGVMIPGVIEAVQYDNEHKFKGYKGGADTINAAIKLKFKLDGYQYPHYSRWMKFNVGEKSTLYKKYVSKLVEGAVPDMDFDLDVLNGLRVNTVWNEENDYQNIDTIFPAGAKARPDGIVPASIEEPPITDLPDDQTPF